MDWKIGRLGMREFMIHKYVYIKKCLPCIRFRFCSMHCLGCEHDLLNLDVHAENEKPKGVNVDAAFGW